MAQHRNERGRRRRPGRAGPDGARRWGLVLGIGLMTAGVVADAQKKAAPPAAQGGKPTPAAKVTPPLSAAAQAQVKKLETATQAAVAKAKSKAELAHDEAAKAAQELAELAKWTAPGGSATPPATEAKAATPPKAEPAKTNKTAPAKKGKR